MALWRFRGRIGDAVLGELTGADELALFAHLRTCTDCRAHYELLEGAARALSPERAASRERARLVAALTPAQPVRPRQTVAFRAALAIRAMVVLAVILWPRAPEDVGLRGGDRPAMVAAALLLYARDTDGGAVKLVADFPLAGRARLSRDQQAQFFVRHPWQRARVVVWATSVEGARHDWPAVEVDQTRAGSAPVGESFSLAALSAGSWRLTTVLSELGGDAGASIELAGTLEVGP